MNPEQLRMDKAGPAVVKALKSRHFDAYYCPTAAEALEKALSLIPSGDVVSWGGCRTAEQLGLMDRLRLGYKTIDRDTAASPAEKVELMRRALLCDTFVTGANAITQDGQLVNIDGNGNRVAAMTYGPKSVIVVAGMNKVVPTLEDAYHRAQCIAAPINTQRFADAKTPCNVTGLCADCKSEASSCCYFSRIRICRPAGKIKVILIGQTLGF